MKFLNRISHGGAKILATFAVMVAAALPLAIAGPAGATTGATPTVTLAGNVTKAYVGTAIVITGTFTSTGTAGTAAFTDTAGAISGCSAVAYTATATTETCSWTPTTSDLGLTTISVVNTDTGGTAGAAGTLAVTVYSTSVPSSSYLSLTSGNGDTATANLNANNVTGKATFAQGWSGSGTAFYSSSDAGNLNGATGSVTATTNAPGVTLSSASEKAAGTSNNAAVTMTVNIAAAANATPGTYSLTITDSTGTVTIPQAFTVSASPTITSFSAPSVNGGQSSVTETIYGSGFVSGTSISFNQTSGLTAPTSWSETSVASDGSSITGTISTSNATAGAYTVNASNTDGGSVTSTATITVLTFGAQNISPASIVATATNTPVTVTGAGFQAGLTVTYTSGGCAAGTTTTVTVNSSTSVSLYVGHGTAATGATCTLTLTNPSGGQGNGNSSTITLGVGTAGSTKKPTISSVTVTPSTPLPIGTGETYNGVTLPAASMVITGAGFDPNNAGSYLFYEGTGTTQNTNLTTSGCVVQASGTSITCSVNVAAGAVAGANNLVVTNGGSGSVASSAFNNAVTVAGPGITAQSPSAIAVGAPIGTVINLTGQGLSNTTSAIVTANAGGTINGIFAVTSPTTATLTLNASPNASDVSTSSASPYLTVTQYLANGQTVTSKFSLTVDAAPTVTGITMYKTDGVTTSTGIGAGATAEKVVIAGSGFNSSTTIGKFVNYAGVADAGVTAKVVSVDAAGQNLTLSVAIPAGDANLQLGYTLTNSDGGTVAVTAFSGHGIVIDAGPTVSAVTPSTIAASSTNAFTITGSGFISSNTTVVSSSSNATCGAATVVTPTSMTVSCTFGAVTSGVNLVVTNLDGGSATYALTPAVTPPVVTPPVVNLHTTGAHGVALVGKTVVITITGGGFYGQPKLTSTAAGVKAVVIKDNGKMLTVRVTVRAGAARGWHTFTIRLANGKMAKVNYLTK
jgi:hypothetical protein